MITITGFLEDDVEKFLEESISVLKENGYTDFSDLTDVIRYCPDFLVYRDGDEIHGVMCFIEELVKEYCFVLLAFVSKEQRNRGVFKSMLSHLSEHCSKSEIGEIRFGVSDRNTVMNEVMGRSSARVHHITYSVDVGSGCKEIPSQAV